MIITWVVFERENEQQFFCFFYAERRHRRQFVNDKYFKKNVQNYLEILKRANSDSMNG